jgi:hypothetical protein
LIFDQRFNQLIRTSKGTEEVFPDPILQAERQALQFITWLRDNKLPSLPLETLVVITNPYSFIKSTANEIDEEENVIRSTKLPKTIESMKMLHQEEKLTKKRPS